MSNFRKFHRINTAEYRSELEDLLRKVPDDEVSMPKEDFIAEHKKLLEVLKNPTKEKLKDEYEEQSKELAEELDKMEDFQDPIDAEDVLPDWQESYLKHAQPINGPIKTHANDGHEDQRHRVNLSDIPAYFKAHGETKDHAQELDENLSPEHQLMLTLLEMGALNYHPEHGFVHSGKPHHPFSKAEEKQGPTKLVHFSRQPGLKHISTNFMGTGTPSQEYKQGLPEVKRAYYYTADSDPEPLVQHGSVAKYTATIDPHNHPIYDLAMDKDGHIKQALQENRGIWESDKILKRIKDAGYYGYKNSQSSLPNVVALFYEHPVDQEEIK